MQAKTWITGFGCTSAAGADVAQYWDALCQGREASRAVPTDRWPVPCSFEPRACLWPQALRESQSVRQLLTGQLLAAWAQAHETLDPVAARDLAAGDRLGVIFASTKGCMEDFVWNDALPASKLDPLTPVLCDFLVAAGLNPRRSICVSNACASALSALFLARLWIAQGDVSQVLVLAADHVGPFVMQGFQGLRALSPTRPRPFDRSRDGLQLGEAAAALVVAASPAVAAPCFELEAVGLDTEGFAATRPSLSGDSLMRACLQLPALREQAPEMIIAHGTATPLNDQTEDQVFARLFEANPRPPLITGTKWCIGHTLAASGAMDLIAACQALATQTVYHLATTREIDPCFRGQYLKARDDDAGATANASASPTPLRRVLVTSLGFGGVHAAATLTPSGGVFS